MLASCGSSEEPAKEEAPKEETMEVSDNVAEDTGPAYVLIMGDDAWEEYTPGRSDLMLLARIDSENGLVTLVTVPRDTEYVYSGQKMKLNAVYAQSGPEAACEAVSSITGVKVTDYVVANFDGLQKLVEYFGDITLDLPYSINYTFYTKDFPDEYFEAGVQTLSPWRTMALSRARTYNDYGLNVDMMRQAVDRQMFIKLAEMFYAHSTDYAATAQAVLPFVETNMPSDKIVTWIEELGTKGEITFYGTSGLFDGGIDAETDLYLIPNDTEKWKTLMDVVDAGGDPSTVSIQREDSIESDIYPVNTKTVVKVS